MRKLDHIFSRKYKVYTNNQGNISKTQQAIERIEEETSRSNLKLFKLIKIVGQNLYLWHKSGSEGTFSATNRGFSLLSCKCWYTELEA